MKLAIAIRSSPRASDIANLLHFEGKDRDALRLLDELSAGCNAEEAAGRLSAHAASLRATLHGQRAQVKDALGFAEDAIREWDQLIESTEPPRREPYVLQRCMSRVAAGQFHHAAAEASELAAQTGVSAQGLYNSACVLSLAARGVASQSSAAEDGPERYATSALGLLERSRQAGFFRSQSARDLLKSDHDLDVLQAAAWNSETSSLIWNSRSDPFAR